jgi:gamma-glutamyltranspeptidase/glutathione hydrolase
VTTEAGVIACGHEVTLRAAETILQEGGNAFDAVVAAQFAACVVEPVLASLGGGGYLLAQPTDGEAVIYDFFVQTPQQRRPRSEVEFFPIQADFGTAQQEFNIGRGSIATPGTVRGVFAIWRELCSMPMRILMEPAIRVAREGVMVNSFQAYILEIVGPIVSATQGARRIFASRTKPGCLLQAGEILRQEPLAETLELLAKEGDDVFYSGEIARTIGRFCKDNGGYISDTDLADYQVIKRKPLTLTYRDAEVMTNGPPSSGGILIAFALKLLEEIEIGAIKRDSAHYLRLLAEIMHLTNKARVDVHLDQIRHPHADRILDQQYLQTYKTEIKQRAQCLRGTTHISVMDRFGNTASMTMSNGEGCGYMVDGLGFMLNNMLGEEDLNPHGFHRWSPNQRMTSMMAPTLIEMKEGSKVALGSGGSNRLRTAILQVLTNLVDFGMSLQDSVTYPRIHYERDLLSVEEGFSDEELTKLLSEILNHKCWPERNLFFGGVHAVMCGPLGFAGCGDPRRGGVFKIV